MDDVVPGFISFYLNGFDYWAISFKNSEIAGSDPTAMKLKRCSFLYAIIKAAKESGSIVVPAEWMENIDFETKFVKDLTANMENENHRLKRGFIYYCYAPEELPANKANFAFTYYKDNYDGPQYWAENSTTSTHKDFFLNYVRMAMFYTKDQFYAKYPKETYPVISKQYEDLLLYMKNTYGIDLESIAVGPQD